MSLSPHPTQSQQSELGSCWMADRQMIGSLSSPGLLLPLVSVSQAETEKERVH